ncbi:hypothetical protein [Streptomyces lavendofoliae]|uniref:Uncharacterized protein n=1 Tax=Streptomyces lavendofoliae TaxID=67314 RepID=A0A918I307_9ACTN|nr:hypothetical protein [Streptomyces lavendofoliae]GGU61911.1 hypothetical protein GCM10010274_58350 [Streptomyces lavendofoliae]
MKQQTKRQALRQRTREQRATRRARKAVATGTPQTARTHLLATGIDPTTAKRYAPAFSRGVAATTTSETSIKLKGRTRKAVTVKLYDQTAFAARPANPIAAARFEQAAHTLAA